MKPRIILIFFCVAALTGSAGEPSKVTEIAIGMSFDTAATAIRVAGGRESRKFDVVYKRPPPKWDDFTLPDRRIITLRSEPSELFPSLYRIAAIYVKSPSDADYKKTYTKGVRVEKVSIEPATTKNTP